jgi:glycine C-acetyltransferase
MIACLRGKLIHKQPGQAIVEACVMGTGIAFPTVPEGKARIRLMLTSEHSRARLDQAMETLERVARRLGLLG